MLCIACVLVLCVSACSGIPDFQDVVGNFTFIFHDFHDLLLTLHNDAGDDESGGACYFTRIDSNLKDPLLTSLKSSTQTRVSAAIVRGSGERVQTTTLDEMRDYFRDRLADFRCAHQRIYTLSFDFLGSDFDEGLWLWTQSRTDNLDWTLNAGTTHTSLTGPQNDHTTHTGKYVSVEASVGRTNQTADLESPPFTLDSALCLRFWYSMYSSNTGTLQVYMAHGNRKETLYSVSGDQRPDWRQGEVSLRPDTQAGLIFIGFRAIMGNGAHGNIALDDVTTDRGVCIAATVDCDFEQAGRGGLCEWNQGVTDTLSWTLHRGPTPTANTGPSTDHTVGQGSVGQYIYMEANDGRPQDTADLVSPVLPLHSALCVSFWYHMQGDNVGRLALSVKNVDTRQTELLWSVFNQQGHDWLHHQVTVLPRHNNASAQIIIRATRGDSIESDIAIDDIKGAPGVCVTS